MRIVVGISGASSPIYGVRTLEVLAACGVETHAIISEGAERTIALENRVDDRRRPRPGAHRVR
jgi:4-hydroxy-3-polyprenylbenzoate decarboxylase